MTFSKFRINKRIKSGFTLMETMIVVGILVIVAAVSIAILPNLKGKLNQKELDAKAEILLQVAQSNLTALKAADREEEYQDTTKFTSFADGQTLESGVSFKNMCYFVAHNDEEFTNKIVPQNEVDPEVWSGSWIVIYNYNNGIVYGVFYSKTNNLNALTYSNMQYLCGYPGGNGSANRVAYGSTVGYYGGGSNSGYLIKMTEPVVKVTNGEKLYATFSLPTLPSGMSGSETIEYEYTLYQDVAGRHYKAKTSKTKLMMDDLTSESTRFKNVFSTDGKYCDLVPGLNTEITVKAIINGIETKESKRVKFNSLFDNATKSAEEKLSGNRIIAVSCGRHLQNLSMTSGCDYKKIGTTNAKQTKSISFNSSSNWYKTYGSSKKFEPILFKSSLNCLTEYNGGGYKINYINIDYVGNIKNVDTSSDEYGTGIFSSFYGTIKNWNLISCTIENGYDKPTGIVAGIMNGKTSKDTIRNVSVSAAKVTTNNGNAGAIAGTISNCNVQKINADDGISYNKSVITTKGGNAGFVSGDNIGQSSRKNSISDVYLVPCEIKSESNNAGFLAGMTKYTSTIKNVKWNETDTSIAIIDEAKRKFTVEGGNAAGGLIGKENYYCDSISECDVSGLTLKSNAEAGGIVGYAYDAKSYSKCSVKNSNISSANNKAGGLIGYEVSGCETINDCHVSGLTITSTGSAGGIIGYAWDAKEIFNCSVKNSNISSTNNTAGGIAGSCNNNYNKDDYIFVNLDVENCKIISDTQPAGGIAGICRVAGAKEGGKTVKVKDENGTYEAFYEYGINTCTVTSTSIESKSHAAGGLVGIAYSVFKVKTATVSNCTVKAATYNTSATITSAGGLIGYLEEEKYNYNLNATYDSINVFKTLVRSYGNTGAAGGIIGRTLRAVSITNSHVYTDGLGDDKTYFTNNKYAFINGYISGGIIGDAYISEDDSIIFMSNTDAASVIGTKNSQYSGGILGQTNNTTQLKGCYSCSYVRAKYVAGLVGCIDNGSTLELNSCYAAGYLYQIGTGSYATGIANAGDSSSTVKGSAVYTVCKPDKGTYYAATKGFKTFEVTGLYYGLAGSSGTETTGGQMSRDMLDKSVFISEINTFAGADYKFLADVTASNPYNLDDGGRAVNAYPYPQLRTNYGDYYVIKEEDLPEKSHASVAYFESYKYSSGTDQAALFSAGDIGLYFCADNPKNSLDTTGKHIYADSYCVALESAKYNSGSVTISLYTEDNTLIKNPITVQISEMSQITSGGVGYRVVDILDKLALKDKIDTTYQQFYYYAVLVFNGVSGKNETEYYYFNPRLAGSVVNTTDATKPETKGGTYYLRTPKHVFGLAQTYYNYCYTTAGSNFIQDADIDYNNYNWNYARGSKPANQHPIGSFNQSVRVYPFISNYEGNYHFIIGAAPASDIDGKTKIGFFGIIGESKDTPGSVQNLYLVNNFGSEITISSESNSKLGVFAGENSKYGTIKNCATTGYKLSHSNSYTECYVGGFVGLNEGIIANCEANTRQIYADRRKNANAAYTLFMGGFVGCNKGTIENCMCSSYMPVNKTQTPDVAAQIGGFAGSNYLTLTANYPILNSYCMTYGDNIPSGFSEDGYRNMSGRCAYYLRSEKTTDKYKFWIAGNKETYTTTHWYTTDLHGGNKLNELDDFRQISNFKATTSYADGMEKGIRTLYAKYNQDCNFIATVRLGDGTPVHFGEWPSSQQWTSPPTGSAYINVRTTMMTGTTSVVTSAAYTSLLTSSLPVQTAMSSMMITSAIADTQDKLAEEISGETTEEDASISLSDEMKSAPAMDVPKMSMTSMSSQLLFVNVTDQETGEDITNKVKVVATSNNSKVEITEDVPMDFVDENTGKTVYELVNSEDSEYAGAKVLMVTAENPGEDEITISIVEQDPSTIDAQLSEYIEEEFEDQETVYVEGEALYVYEPAVVSATVESIRHIGITQNFDEGMKLVKDDIILPTGESAGTYTKENSQESSFTLSKVDFGDDKNANIILYSVDGFGFDATNDDYVIDKVEIVRHDTVATATKPKTDSEIEKESEDVDPEDRTETEVIQEESTENSSETELNQEKIANSTGEVEQIQKTVKTDETKVSDAEQQETVVKQAAWILSDEIHAVESTESVELVQDNSSESEEIHVTENVQTVDENPVNVIPQANGVLFKVYDSSVVSQDEDGTPISKWNDNDYYCKIGKTVTEKRGESRISYLPITVVGKYSNPITFRITLKHNDEIVILDCDLASVKNEFNVVHMDGSTVIKQQKVGYGQPISYPHKIELESAKINSTGYIYPSLDSLSDVTNWTPLAPVKIYEDMTFTLNKTPITYKVSFNANGGEGHMDPITVKYDDITHLSKDAFTNGDLELKGWALTPDGEIEYINVMDNAASEQGAEVVLYAIWGEKTEPVTYDDKVEEEGAEPAVYGWN